MFLQKICCYTDSKKEGDKYEYVRHGKKINAYEIEKPEGETTRDIHTYME